MANAEQETEILMNADKIRQNQKEEQAFEENFQKLLDGDKATASRPLIVGNQENSDKAMEIPNADKTANRENLFPVLNAMRNTLDNKLDSLNEKKLTRSEKIERNTRKIEKLTYRAERLENTNDMLKSVFGKIPGVKLLIEQNEKKIDKIKNKSIPKREQKIKKHKSKIVQLDKKIDYTKAKTDKLTAMSGIVKSFGILNNEERRESFSNSMDLLHDSSKKILAYKIDRCDAKIAQCDKELQNTRFTEDRTAIDSKRSSLADKKQTFQLRLNKLNKVTLPFAEQKDNVTDVLIGNTEKIIDSTPNDAEHIPDLAEKICVSNAEIAYRAEHGQNIDNYLKNAEMMIEDDYNSIDGIINNGKKKQEEVKTSKSGAQIKVTNSDYRDSVPKENQKYLRFDSEQAQKVIGELKANGVPHASSYNLDTKKITIMFSAENKDAFFACLKKAGVIKPKQEVDSDTIHKSKSAISKAMENTPREQTKKKNVSIDD